MRTLEEVRGRCRIELDADGREHWIWTGACDERVGAAGLVRIPVLRAPDYSRDPAGQLTTVQFGARAVWNIARQKPVPKGKRVYRTCSHDGCMHPDCVAAMTPTAAGARERKLGSRRGMPGAHERALRVWDKRGRAVPDEKVDAIVVSDAPAKDLAAEHGVDLSTVYRYRKGELRKRNIRRAAGIFSGLLG